MEEEDGRLPISGTAGETAVALEIGGEDCRRRAASNSRHQAKVVAHAQAIIICGLGAALSWTNANKQNALGESRDDESLAPCVFFTASCMKAFGAVLALFFAQKALSNGGDDDLGTGGPPIMMSWGAKATGEHPDKHSLLMSGFALQAIGVGTPVWDIFFGESIGAAVAKYAVAFAAGLFWIMYVGPTIRYFQELLGDPRQRCPVQICVADKRQIPARALASALVLLFLTGPVAVYLLESVFIFVSESTEAAAAGYILAVLDLITVFLALPFLCSFAIRVVPRLWGGEWAGVRGGGRPGCDSPDPQQLSAGVCDV